MPRTIPPASRELAIQMIRAGGTTRGIAERAGIGVGTVTRLKAEMGLGSTPNGHRAARAVNVSGGRPPNLSKLGTNDNPSPAAIRLAEFDKVVARAIARPTEDFDDGE